jgi:hypothetical protein
VDVAVARGAWLAQGAGWALRQAQVMAAQSIRA